MEGQVLGSLSCVSMCCCQEACYKGPVKRKPRLGHETRKHSLFDLLNMLLVGFSAHLMEMKYLFSYFPFNTWILKNVFIYEQNRKKMLLLFF